MSDQDSSEKIERADIEEEEVPEYVPPISAQPPKVVKQEDSHVEVSASPAFQCLDEVSV